MEGNLLSQLIYQIRTVVSRYEVIGLRMWKMKHNVC